MTDNHKHAGGDGAAAFTPSPAQIMAGAVANAVAAALADALPEVIARVIPPPASCSVCLRCRYMWEVAHERELMDALAEACTAHGIAPGSPESMRLDPAPFLPESLRPGADPDGLPPLRLKNTTVNGNDYCTMDLPDLPQPGQPRKQFLIASGAWTPGMLAQLARQGTAG